MRIAFLVADGLSLRGGNKRICEYASRLYRRGHDVHILTPDKSLPEWFNVYKDTFKLDNIEQYRHFKSDIAVATGGRNCRRLSRMLNVRSKLVSVVLLESLTKPSIKHGVEQDRDRFLKDCYGQGWIYYANSTWMKEIVENRFGQKCHLVLAPSNEKMKPVVSFRPADREWALGYGHGDWKGGQRTADAIALAKKSIANLEMIHYSSRGAPRSRSMVKHWSNPSQDLLPQIYSSANVTIHSSRYEGFANVVMESMSCGTPVISHKTPGIEDLIIHNETGIIVDEFDITHMARAIVRLLLDQNLYNKLKIRCIEHVQKFTWGKTLTTLEQVFEEALHK